MHLCGACTVWLMGKGQGMGVCEPYSIELLTMRTKQCGCGAMMKRTCHWVYRAAHQQLQHHVSHVWQNSVWKFNAILLPVLLFMPLLFHLFSKHCCLRNAALIVKGLPLITFDRTFCRRLEFIKIINTYVIYKLTSNLFISLHNLIKSYTTFFCKYTPFTRHAQGTKANWIVFLYFDIRMFILFYILWTLSTLSTVVKLIACAWVQICLISAE